MYALHVLFCCAFVACGFGLSEAEHVPGEEMSWMEPSDSLESLPGDTLGLPEQEIAPQEPVFPPPQEETQEAVPPPAESAEKVESIAVIEEAITPEPMLVETPEPAPPQPTAAPEKNRSVKVLIEARTPLALGDRVVLKGVLSGYEPEEALAYQWQYSAYGVWMDVPGANGLTHAFTVDESNACYQWRLEVRTLS